MHEPYPGGPGGGYQPSPGGRRQPSQADQADHWLNDDWFRPQRDQEYRPGPREVSGERGRGGHHRRSGRRRPELDSQRRGAGRNWALVAGMVFFLIDTSLMADGFARPVATASRVLVVFIWLISLVVVALLWLRGSPKFGGVLAGGGRWFMSRRYR